MNTVEIGKSETLTPNMGEIVLYQPDNSIRLDVRVENETVWLSLNQMANLFDRDKSVISRHITNIFKEEELVMDSTVANFATVQIEGKYNSTVKAESLIINSVGQRPTERNTHEEKAPTGRNHSYEP